MMWVFGYGDGYGGGRMLGAEKDVDVEKDVSEY